MPHTKSGPLQSSFAVVRGHRTSTENCEAFATTNSTGHGMYFLNRSKSADSPPGLTMTNIQERKNSPKSKCWGRISRGRPRGYPGGRPGAKTSVRPSKSWKNKHFGADIHDPKARTSMTLGAFQKTSVRKNFGLTFHSPNMGGVAPGKMIYDLPPTPFWSEPRGPSETSVCRGVKIAAGQFLPLSCRSITLTTRVF